MNRYHLMQQLYSPEQYDKVTNAKVLIVGAGGIGCEILKNLALLGVKNMELIDLDTIDVSNLNRQFLFRPEHVGQSKAIVAAQAAMTFNPEVHVIAYHANVKNPEFNVNYISEFDVVLNALDNIDARRHVNRLCLAANIPLFDSGTTGYLGQVVPILKGYTSCYECFPKPTPKVYPICTIRSTPDKPVHCIVWAKECLKLIFGKASESMLFEDESATSDKSEYMDKLPFPEDKSPASLLAFAKTLTIALFHHEVQKRIDMEVYKTAKCVPAPLSLSLIDRAVERVTAIIAQIATPPSAKPSWDQQLWNIDDSLVEFLHSFITIFQSPEEAALIGQLTFDKDDLWSMKFVTAASNLRSFIFQIPLLSFHDAKGIAGNIIPAIATTNAIVSGIQVMQMMKFLLHFHKSELFAADLSTEKRQQLEQELQKYFPQLYCLRHPTRKGYYLQPSTADGPQETCYVCRKSSLTLQLDVHATTLQELLTKVLKNKLGFNAPTISVGANLLYEEGEDCDEDLQENLVLTLSQLPGGGIQDGSIVTVDDFTQNLQTDIVITHVAKERLEENEATAVDLFVLNGPPLVAAASSKAALEEKYRKARGDAIYEQIVKTANLFLRKALVKDQEVKGFTATTTDPSEANIVSDSTAGTEPETPQRKSKNAHLLKYALVRSKESIPLALGDKICYHQKLTGNECESLVEEFLDHHKLALSNGDVLNSDDLICKMVRSSAITDSPTSTSATNTTISRLYQKHPAGYQEVSNFEFDDGSIPTRRSKRAANLNLASTPLKNTSSSQEDPSQSNKKQRR